MDKKRMRKGEGVKGKERKGRRKREREKGMER
jgi:hypothetical protein